MQDATRHPWALDRRTETPLSKGHCSFTRSEAANALGVTRTANPSASLNPAQNRYAQSMANKG